MFIFEWLGSLSGWVLWFFFDMVSNYAVAIVLFTLFINLLLFPFSIKQKKSLSANARLAEKQAELKKRCGNDIKRYNEEQAKLYEKEGVNPLGGCFSLFLPLILMFTIYDAVRKPLQSVLHIAAEKIAQAVTTVQALPGIGETFKGGYYEQLQLVRVFPQVKEHLTMFNPQELSAITEYSSGFNFFGINLLSTPNTSTFMEFVWIIPALYFVVSIINTYITQKTSGAPQQGPGCMKYTLYVMPLITVWMAYNWPAAVGLYMIVNLIVMSLQNIILNKFYNAQTFAAKEEAARFALLEEREGK